jgi:hypothetical protein
MRNSIEVSNKEAMTFCDVTLCNMIGTNISEDFVTSFFRVEANAFIIEYIPLH